ncbi:MAG TPA: tRNA guanosine(34) transglycosylase Tgt [Atribacteraceae bacterium]|nr:tRNA guanosine(34) transglycosylase Tgt [Atribacteraceae bacterium]
MIGHFEVLQIDNRSRARRGLLKTAHGQIETPVFMPVGTQGTVKAVAPDRLRDLGVDIFLCNTYHLHLRPGEALLRDAGGLHSFISWDGSLMTDSGGFQVFSLSALNTVDDRGVTFRSHLDGSLHTLTPESCIQIQKDIGADIVMVLDQCIGYPATLHQETTAAHRSMFWARRCKEAFCSANQLLFGIAQGGMQEDLRRWSAGKLVETGFDGYALGGLSVGEPKPLMYSMIEACEPILPVDRPRYLMGVGSPDCILEGVARGIDMFDCVLPTRNARNSSLLTRFGRLNIKREEYSRDFSPPDSDCGCFTCRTFSRAYLRHLFKAGEILAAELATIHNLSFMVELLESVRKSVKEGYFMDFYTDFLRRWDNP